MNAMGGSNSYTNHGYHADISNRTNENPTPNGADGDNNDVEGEEVIITGGDHVEVDVGDEHPHYTIMHHDDTMEEHQAVEGHTHDNKIEHMVVVDHQEEEALHHAEEILISDNNDGRGHSHDEYAYEKVQAQDDNDNHIYNLENIIDHQHQIEQLQEQDGELQAENGPETQMVIDNNATVVGELHHDAIKHAHEGVMEMHENNEAANFENQHSMNEPMGNAKTEAMDGNNAMMGRDSSVEYYHQDGEERVVVIEELQHSQYQQHEEHQSDQRYQGQVKIIATIMMMRMKMRNFSWLSPMLLLVKYIKSMTMQIIMGMHMTVKYLTVRSYKSIMMPKRQH